MFSRSHSPGHHVEPARLADRPSPLDRVDPRSRILAAVAFVALVAVANRFSTLGLALAFAAAAGWGTRLRLLGVLRRVWPINVVMLVMIVVLPWTTGDEALVTLGPLVYSREGLLLALVIALKGNAILLALVVLLGTLDTTTLGHALSHLWVPDKLTHLLLFTVRYVDVLHREHLRLAEAMRVRAFRPRMDRHTYQSYGFLAGMLLVRSLDRSERILAAMKCRGFRGHFYLLHHFYFSVRDAYFAAAVLAVLAILAAVQWR